MGGGCEEGDGGRGEVEERCIYDGVFMRFGGYSEAEADGYLGPLRLLRLRQRRFQISNLG